MDERIKLGGAATGIAAMAFAIGVAVSGAKNSEGAKTNAAVEAADVELAEETDGTDFKPGEYAEAIAPVRAADPMLVDLGGQVVAAGEAATAGATFPRGARITGAELMGDSKADFALDANAQCKDSDTGTTCSVTAVNTSGKPARLFALVRYEVVELPSQNDADAGPP